MSTRSITQFVGPYTKPLIVYRHSDGYPEGAGVDIMTFLREVKKLDKKHTTGQWSGNGARMQDPQRLAAQYVVFLADMFNNTFVRVSETEGKGYKYVKNTSKLDFLSVYLVDDEWTDYAYRYVIDTSKLDSKGLPTVTCFESEGNEDGTDKIVPIPKPKRKKANA